MRFTIRQYPDGMYSVVPYSLDTCDRFGWVQPSEQWKIVGHVYAANKDHALDLWVASRGRVGC